jgi:hypothetical protein
MARASTMVTLIKYRYSSEKRQKIIFDHPTPHPSQTTINGNARYHSNVILSSYRLSGEVPEEHSNYECENILSQFEDYF